MHRTITITSTEAKFKKRTTELGVEQPVHKPHIVLVKLLQVVATLLCHSLLVLLGSFFKCGITLFSVSLVHPFLMLLGLLCLRLLLPFLQLELSGGQSLHLLLCPVCVARLLRSAFTIR